MATEGPAVWDQGL